LGQIRKTRVGAIEFSMRQFIMTAVQCSAIISHLLVCKNLKRSLQNIVDRLFSSAKALSQVCHSGNSIHVACTITRTCTCCVVFRLKLTIGRTPVSLGSNRTKENPSLRWRSISSASACSIVSSIAAVRVVYHNYLFDFHKSV